MSYAVLRIRKITSMGNVHATEKHLKRTRETPNADPEKLHLNKNYVSGNFVENVENLLPEKRRKNAVLAVEHLMTASPEFFEKGFDNRSVKDRIDLWAQTSVQWAKDTYGEKNIASAELHLDESTPHLHLVIVPLVKDKSGVEKLNARELFGGHKKMMAMQDSYARRFESFGLERGVKGSKATHTEIKQFYGSVEKALNGVKMPTKTGVLDFAYTERLEKHIKAITPLTGENQVILRERTNLQKNLKKMAVDECIKNTVAKEHQNLKDSVAGLQKELNKTNGNIKIAVEKGIAKEHQNLKDSVAGLQSKLRYTEERLTTANSISVDYREKYNELMGKREEVKTLTATNEKLLSERELIFQYLYDQSPKKSNYPKVEDYQRDFLQRANEHHSKCQQELQNKERQQGIATKTPLPQRRSVGMDMS